MLKLRAVTIQRLRNFFIKNGFIELDAPALSPTLIPESSLEVFKTEYIEPWTGMSRPLYLVPSPEIYIKRIIAQYKINVFQISKCYRNAESMGRIHNPEFTMLEYCTINADYKISAKLTENMLRTILPPPKPDNDAWAALRPPFTYITIDEAFEKYAGFKLSEAQDQKELAYQAKAHNLAEPLDKPFDAWTWNDLFELIFTQCVESKLPVTHPLCIMNYPAQVPSLAKEFPGEGGKKPLWKERWKLYAAGIELASCRTEEKDPTKVHAFFENENIIKNRIARVKHPVDAGYWKIFKDFPDCSGVRLGVDRLIALISGHKEITSVLPFTL